MLKRIAIGIVVGACVSNCGIHDGEVGQSIGERDNALARSVDDPTPVGSRPRTTESDCDDRVDNDRDGKIDAADSDCKNSGYAWSVTAIWNGFRSEFDTSSCLNNPNKEYGMSWSSVGTINDTYFTGGNITVDVRANFGFLKNAHSDSPLHASGYQSIKSRAYYTVIAYNEYYLRSFPGSGSITCTASSGACTATSRLRLDVDDNWDLSNKKALVVLKGYAYENDSYHECNYLIGSAYCGIPFGVNPNIELRDHEASVSLADSDVDCDATGCWVDVQLTSDFNGANAADYTASLSYNVFVYDSNYVTFATQNDIGNQSWSFADSDSYPNYQISTTKDATVSVSWADEAKSENVFVGLKRFGWNYGSEDTEVKYLWSYAKKEDWNASTQTATVFAKGEAYKKDCSIVGDGSKHLKPNKLKTRVIVCRNSSVCKAVSGMIDIVGGSDGPTWSKDENISISGLDFD